MEGCFLNSKHGPNPNVLQTGTAARGQCQFAAGEPRHIFLHIFLSRLHSCCLSCMPAYTGFSSPLQLPPWLQRAHSGCDFIHLNVILGT